MALGLIVGSLVQLSIVLVLLVYGLLEMAFPTAAAPLVSRLTSWRNGSVLIPARDVLISLLPLAIGVQAVLIARGTIVGARRRLSQTCLWYLPSCLVIFAVAFVGFSRQPQVLSPDGPTFQAAGFAVRNCAYLVPILLVLAWYSAWIARSQQRGLCASCGYDLRASSSGKCPECGKEFDVRTIPNRIEPPQAGEQAGEQ
jgi:predicted RNA-binding Zn-ribbon protein involved in translation (DUF1610 family)